MASTGCQLEESWVANSLSVFAVREEGLQVLTVEVYLVLFAFTQREQEEVVIDVIEMLIVQELIHRPQQGATGQGEVLHLLHEQDAAVVEAVDDELVGGSQLVLGERNLFEIILALVRVVCQRVLQSLLLLGQFLTAR